MSKRMSGRHTDMRHSGHKHHGGLSAAHGHKHRHPAKIKHAEQLLTKLRSHPEWFRQTVEEKQPPHLPRRQFVLAGLYVVCLGLTGIVYDDLSSAHKNKMANQAASPPQNKALPPGLTAMAQSPAQLAGNYSPLRERLRPKDFLDKFALAGKTPIFIPVSKLKLSVGGNPHILYCLLYALLDEATERSWKKAGMFRDEHGPASPFLRTVTITTQETLDNLADWHVEGVSLDDPSGKK